jgi:hypothetical protein
MTGLAKPSPAMDAPAAARPAQPGLIPVLVTAPGRSGTTLLMGLLARSPEIVAAELVPYEVRMIAYYAVAFTTLTGQADWDRSHHPDRLEGDGFHVGSNPFRHKQYAHAFRNDAARQEYFEKFVTRRIGRCARDLINEYYRRLAADGGKTSARFFAEKTNNLHRPTRMFARRAFGEVRELVIVRDPRDVLCSHVAYFSSAQDKAFSDLSSAVRQLTALHGENRPDLHMLRYEDMVRGDAACFAGMSNFLGTRIEPDAGDQGEKVFRVHATSATPQSSVARWRTDLPEALKVRCAREWAGFLTRFGYAIE